MESDNDTVTIDIKEDLHESPSNLSVVCSNCSLSLTNYSCGPDDFPLCEKCLDEFCFETEGAYQKYLDYCQNKLLTESKNYSSANLGISDDIDFNHDEILSLQAELLSNINAFNKSKKLVCLTKCCNIITYIFPLKCLLPCLVKSGYGLANFLL